MSHKPFEPFSTNFYWIEEADPYKDPATGVLRNLFGVTNSEDFAKLDRTLWAGRAVEAMAVLKDEPVSLAAWQKLHKICFQDLFDWAGELRTVQLSKGDSMFAHPEYIEREAAKIFVKMQQFSWGRPQGYSIEQLCHHMAVFFGDLNAVHPFREGNGRTQRLLFIMWLAQHGYMLDWCRVEPDENLMAMIASFQGSYEPLAAVFHKILVI